MSRYKIGQTFEYIGSREITGLSFLAGEVWEIAIVNVNETYYLKNLKREDRPQYSSQYLFSKEELDSWFKRVVTLKDWIELL